MFSTTADEMLGAGPGASRSSALSWPAPKIAREELRLLQGQNHTAQNNGQTVEICSSNKHSPIAQNSINLSAERPWVRTDSLKACIIEPGIGAILGAPFSCHCMCWCTGGQCHSKLIVIS